MSFESTLSTKISGKALPGSKVTIFVNPKKPAVPVKVNPDGNFSIEMPLLPGTSNVYGIMQLTKEIRYFHLSILTGKITVIKKEQYQKAIQSLTARYNQKPKK